MSTMTIAGAKMRSSGYSTAPGASRIFWRIITSLIQIFHSSPPRSYMSEYGMPHASRSMKRTRLPKAYCESLETPSTTCTRRRSHTSSSPVDPVVPLDREVPAVRHREQVPLAEVAPVHPRDVPRVAAVAVDVRVLPAERVRALRGGEPAHAAQRRQVEPGVVLLGGVQVAVADEADALHVEGLQHRVAPRL